MGSIIFQIVLITVLMGFLIFLARDDRRNRALRALEDAEEQRQAELKTGQGASSQVHSPSQDRAD